MELATDFYKTSVLFKPVFYKRPSFYIDIFNFAHAKRWLLILYRMSKKNQSV